MPVHPGTGPGLSRRNLGERGGSETVILNIANLPNHAHSLPVTNKRAGSRLPLGRIPEVADVVQPVLFFCSTGADFVTGQTVMVDGGASVV